MYYTIRAAKSKAADQTVQADLFLCCSRIALTYFLTTQLYCVDYTIKLSYFIVYENTIQITVVLNIFYELKNLIVLSVCFGIQLLKM